MYTKKLPFKDYLGRPKNAELQFNLTERETFKLMVEFKAIFDWRDSLKAAPRELNTEELIEFYNNFEAILLASYGEVSEDGLYFDKSGRYKFEDSAMFAAYMIECVTDPAETSRLIDGIMPKGMEELVKTADENLAKMAADPATEAPARAEIARLQAELAAARASSEGPAVPPTG